MVRQVALSVADTRSAIESEERASYFLLAWGLKSWAQYGTAQFN